MIPGPTIARADFSDPIPFSFCQDITPWKINTEPKNGGLEDHFPFQFVNFQGRIFDSWHGLSQVPVVSMNPCRQVGFAHLAAERIGPAHFVGEPSDTTAIVASLVLLFNLDSNTLFEVIKEKDNK